MSYFNIREEELKLKVAKDFFKEFDCTKIIGNIDFCVTLESEHKAQTKLIETESLLWAESKTGKSDLLKSIVQLILTIGKARTFDKFLPPHFLGAFDAEKIAFVPYNAIVDIFSLNDFNWNVTPSNYETKEFHLVAERIQDSFKKAQYVFEFLKDEGELRHFIQNNVAKATESGKILIDKNNFVPIYLRWLDAVKPCINFDWAEGRKQNILDSDFYLADLFVDDKGTSVIEDDTPLNDTLFVVFKNSHYAIAKENLKSLFNASIEFKDKNIYEQFWKKYKRPPLTEIQHYIIDRRDLLIPQDVRERKGAFFTPKKWVELSQRYITDVLGPDWQDEYTVWDCAAGTGNLLAGLRNKYNIWASTLDQADVNVMHERIDNGAILLKDHVFQFDFLNDDFSKLPKGLQDIINDPQKRKKLVIFINPPYAEAGDAKQKTGTGQNKENVSNLTDIHKKYNSIIKDFAKRELFIQFFTRVYAEIPGAILAEFSKLKMIQSPYFEDYRQYFKAELKSLFVVPANTFDNVKGIFPIGFFIWDTKNGEVFKEVEADVYNADGELESKKKFYSYDGFKNINDWLRPTWKNTQETIGFLACNSNDFQNQNGIFIEINKRNQSSTYFKPVSSANLIESAIYFTVRHCIDATWLNDRDQFLYPNDGWKSDTEFQNDCLAFTLFSNNIQSKHGTNHWIPFTEAEVDAREKFESDFMSRFIAGKIQHEASNDLFSAHDVRTTPLQFSPEAAEVLKAGRELWRYYHKQPASNPNASLYDIREHFQGRNDRGKMNNKSSDEKYTQLLKTLRENLQILAKKIEPKVYEYGFLKA